MSKGSWRRPTDTKKYNENFDKIFGKKKDEPKEQDNQCPTPTKSS